MSKYKTLQDGKTYRYDKESILRFACCDCGVVHDFDIGQTRKYLYFRAIQKPRNSAQLRRCLYGKLHRGVGKWVLKRK